MPCFRRLIRFLVSSHAKTMRIYKTVAQTVLGCEPTGQYCPCLNSKRDHPHSTRSEGLTLFLAYTSISAVYSFDLCAGIRGGVAVPRRSACVLGAGWQVGQVRDRAHHRGPPDLRSQAAGNMPGGVLTGHWCSHDLRANWPVRNWFLVVSLQSRRLVCLRRILVADSGRFENVRTP